MKQLIQMGNTVDDGRGDYLRVGARKINENTNEVFGKLGDGDTVFPAGAWKVHDAKTSRTLEPTWGDSYSVNTISNDVVVKLPKGTSADYGKVIKLRDVWSTWAQRNVIVNAAQGDTIKGKTSQKLYRDLMDVELVYCSPGRWEYADNKLVNKITSSNIATVSKKEYEMTQGQTDILNVFGDTNFNSTSLEVYHKGNLLYYGDKFSSKSDYGSPGKTATEIVALDGKSIRLRFPAQAGDIIVVKTYTDDLAVYRSSYTARSIRVYDKSTNIVPVEGQIVVADLSTKKIWDFFEDFGFTETDGQFNPMGTEVLINGVQLTKAGEAGLETMHCETDLSQQDEANCPLDGWKETGIDFSVIKNSSDEYRQIKVQDSLESGDVLTVRWFNNDIGTTLSWEEIEDKSDDRYLVTHQDNPFTLKNRVVYAEPSNINPCTVINDPLEETHRNISSYNMMFDMIYPVGSVYMNAHNRANPRDYMGFGTWVPYAKGQAIVGWSGDNDVNFGKYEGSCGTLSAPGKTGGHVDVSLTPANVPVLESNDEVLIKSKDGDILVGQCQVDPDGEGPGYFKYKEGQLKINNESTTPIPVNVLQPYVTVAAWLRIK